MNILVEVYHYTGFLIYDLYEKVIKMSLSSSNSRIFKPDMPVGR